MQFWRRPPRHLDDVLEMTGISGCTGSVILETETEASNSVIGPGLLASGCFQLGLELLPIELRHFDSRRRDS